MSYLKGVFGSITRPSDANCFQHACVPQLLHNERLIKTHFPLNVKYKITDKVTLDKRQISYKIISKD